MLASISSILIGIDADGKITRWNSAAETTFDIKPGNVIGQPFSQCGIKWDWALVQGVLNPCKGCQPKHIEDFPYERPDGKPGFLSVTVNSVVNDGSEQVGCLLLASDVTERKILESQLIQSQKLESIGQLAAGIAHEINTPIQFVGDNTRFLKTVFGRIETALARYEELLDSAKNSTVSDELVSAIVAELKRIRLPDIVQEIPKAIEETLTGVDRVSKIVKAMKEYSHPDTGEKTPTDLNKALENTVTVCRNEWKYYADMVLDLDPDLPVVTCLPGELNQAFLNVLVNAAQAMADIVEKDSANRGLIRVSTQHCDGWVEIKISDTGPGIPKQYRTKIFDPFFTTKEVGKGTGQGLAIAYNVVVAKHAGTIAFVTEEGKGTTFSIRLPVEASLD